MSISSLPIELVRQIIESSIPSTFHSTTYNGRQSTLLPLCLVCKRFRDIAQPLLFASAWIDRQWKLDALLNSLTRKGGELAVRQAIVQARRNRPFDTGSLEELLRSSRSLQSLTLDLDYGRPLDLSVLQDLPYLTDLSLFGSNYEVLSNFRLQALTSLGFNYNVIQFAATLLNPEVLPSLRSLALFELYGGLLEYLNQSRLADLVPQLETLHLSSHAIRSGLDYLVPAFSRTLFEFFPDEPYDLVDLLRVAQHLRIQQDLFSEEDLPKFVQSIENQDRQISLRTIYLDIRFADLSSLRVGPGKVVQELLRVCKEKGIEVIYEYQERGIAGEKRPSEEFSRRQRELRKSEEIRVRALS